MLFIGYHTTMIDFFFADIRNARRKTIDLIFKVLKPEVKKRFHLGHSMAEMKASTKSVRLLHRPLIA